MNTLTNERLEEIVERRSPSLRWEEAPAMATELLSLRAQLAELRGQEAIAYIISDKYDRRGDLTRRPAEAIYSAEDIAEHEIACTPLYARPVPPAASQPIIVTDDMAMAFHRATTDGDIGSDDVSDIKDGLRAALCNISTALPCAARPVASNQDYMCDSAYIAGLKAGYNLGVDENDTDLNSCIENYRKQMVGTKPPAASQTTCDVWKWCCEYQYNKDWPALDYDIFDHQHEAEEKARDTEGNVFPIYKSTQETQVDFLPKNLDRALTIMGIAIPESKEEFNFQSERWIQRLINAVLRMGKQSQHYTVQEKMPHEVMALIQSSADKLFDDDDAQEIWNACRAAMLQSGNSPVTPDGWIKGKFAYDTLFNAIGKAVNIQGEALSISVKAFEDSMLAAAPQHKGE